MLIRVVKVKCSTSYLVIQLVILFHSLASFVRRIDVELIRTIDKSYDLTTEATVLVRNVAPVQSN